MVSRSAVVPITMGASGAATLMLDDFAVTDAVFPAGEYLAPHVHERASLAIMLEGSFDLSITHRVYACEPGSAAIEPAEERHDNRLGTAGAHVVVVQPDNRARERLGPSAALFSTVHYARKTPVCAAAWRIARELRAPDTATPLAVEGLVLEILALATRREIRTDLRRAPVPRWLAQVRDELHASFLKAPPLRALAARAGVHPDHLARAFRVRFGVPVGTYVRRLRLDWAARRLEAGAAESIPHIAFAAGFADQSHFTRAFRRHTGLTPGEYRREFGAPRITPRAL